MLGEKPLLEKGDVDDAITGKLRYAFVNVWRPISKVRFYLFIKEIKNIHIYIYIYLYIYTYV